MSLAVAANVTDKASLEGAAALIEQQLGKCDLLLNGTGGNHQKVLAAKYYSKEINHKRKRD